MPTVNLIAAGCSLAKVLPTSVAADGQVSELLVEEVGLRADRQHSQLLLLRESRCPLYERRCPPQIVVAELLVTVGGATSTASAGSPTPVQARLGTPGPVHVIPGPWHSTTETYASDASVQTAVKSLIGPHLSEPDAPVNAAETLTAVLGALHRAEIKAAFETLDRQHNQFPVAAARDSVLCHRVIAAAVVFVALLTCAGELVSEHSIAEMYSSDRSCHRAVKSFTGPHDELPAAPVVLLPIATAAPGVLHVADVTDEVAPERQHNQFPGDAWRYKIRYNDMLVWPAAAATALFPAPHSTTDTKASVVSIHVAVKSLTGPHTSAPPAVPVVRAAILT